MIYCILKKIYSLNDLLFERSKSGKSIYDKGSGYWLFTTKFPFISISYLSIHCFLYLTVRQKSISTVRLVNLIKFYLINYIFILDVHCSLSHTELLRYEIKAMLWTQQIWQKLVHFAYYCYNVGGAGPGCWLVTVIKKRVKKKKKKRKKSKSKSVCTILSYSRK